MNVEEIRGRVTGGFKPFIIHTSDGREFKVPHPEFIAIGKYSIAVVDEKGYIATIAPLRIASIKEYGGRSRKRGQAA